MNKFNGVVEFVRREKFTNKSINDVWDGPKLNEKHDGVSRQANEHSGLLSTKFPPPRAAMFKWENLSSTKLTYLIPSSGPSRLMVLSGSFISKNSYKVSVLLIHMTESGKCDYKFTGS